MSLRNELGQNDCCNKYCITVTMITCIFRDPPSRPSRRVLFSNPLNLNLASRVFGLSPPSYCHHISQIYLIVSTFQLFGHDGIVLVILKLVTALDLANLEVDAPPARGPWGVGIRSDKLFITSLCDILSLPKRPQRTLVSHQRHRAKTIEPML